MYLFSTQYNTMLYVQIIHVFLYPTIQRLIYLLTILIFIDKYNYPTVHRYPTIHKLYILLSNIHPCTSITILLSIDYYIDILLSIE